MIKPRDIIQVALDLPATAAEIALFHVQHPEWVGTEWAHPRCWRMGHYWQYPDNDYTQIVNCTACGKPNRASS